MTGRFQRYPEYRESEGSWLGPVPATWRTSRLRFAAGVRVSNVDKHAVEGETPVELCNYVDVYKNDRITRALPFMHATATPAQVATFGLDVGDVIITKDSETPADIAVPAVVAEPLPGVVCGYHLAILRPRTGQLYGPFLRYMLTVPRVANQFSIEATGVTRFGLTYRAINDVWLYLPRADEQKSIAAFLDRETGRIDALVSKKVDVLNLIAERHASRVEAIVLGRRRSSGATDAATMKLKFLARLMQTGPFGSQLHAEEYVTGGVPVINPSNLKEGRPVADEDCTVTEAKAQELARHRVTPGDILFARRGELGRCGVVGSEHVGWLCGTGSLLVRLPRTCVPAFFHAYFSSRWVAEWLANESVGSTMDNLNTDILGRLPIPVPTQEEQQGAAEEIAALGGGFARERELGRIQINLLREQRQALITAAVTGQIDVRGEVSLPEDA